MRGGLAHAVSVQLSETPASRPVLLRSSARLPLLRPPGGGGWVVASELLEVWVLPLVRGEPHALSWAPLAWWGISRPGQVRSSWRGCSGGAVFHGWWHVLPVGCRLSCLCAVRATGGRHLGPP